MRFYVSPDSVFSERHKIEIRDKSEVHHIRNVMRLKPGMEVTCFDGKGREYSGEIKEADRDLVIIEIKKSRDIENSVRYEVALYQALPKKNKMDFIVEKAVELGVDRIVPIITERTVVGVKERAFIKLERWARIVKASSKQCGRIRFPVISTPVDFNNALTESKKTDLVVFAAIYDDAMPLREILLKDSNPKNISVFVGPEGDFSPDEVSMAKKAGYNICSLGSLVLKVETAAMFILSCLNYEYNI